MNRYLFRARDIDRGEWKIGFLVHDHFYTGKTSSYVIMEEDNDYLVDRKTIGQFVGRDERNEMCFEGDVLENNIYGRGHIEYDEDRGEYRIYFPHNKASFNLLIMKESCKKIGNIFDNPDYDRQRTI